VSLGRWFGIEIRLEPSWFVIFVLLTFSLSGMLAAAHPDLAPAVHRTVALLGSVFFFGSILTHEMAHSLVAIRSGVRVHSITLHIFGGVSRLDRRAYEMAFKLVEVERRLGLEKFLGTLHRAVDAWCSMEPWERPHLFPKTNQRRGDDRFLLVWHADCVLCWRRRYDDRDSSLSQSGS
jgi:hypothetical protein